MSPVSFGADSSKSRPSTPFRFPDKNDKEGWRLFGEAKLVIGLALGNYYRTSPQP
jgi:hypothetical protein